VKRQLLGGVIALAVSLSGVAAADASTPGTAVAKQDMASTKAFIALQERYDIATIRSAPAINAAERVYAGRIRASCSGALTRLPKKLSHRQGIAVARFISESFLALDINAFAPLRTVSDRIAGEQRQLRFSDPALQWQVGIDGAANNAYFALRTPNLCTDGRLLASSAFTRITPAGARFVRDALTLDTSAAVSPSSLVRTMRSYAPAAVAAALKRLPRLQRSLDHAIPIGKQFTTLVRTLGLRRGSINLATPGSES
jgi:hypothetical protein